MYVYKTTVRWWNDEGATHVNSPKLMIDFEKMMTMKEKKMKHLFCTNWR